MSKFMNQEIIENNMETSNTETSNVETSNIETFNTETSIIETSNTETSNKETSIIETSIIETSITETSNRKIFNILTANATDIGGGRENQDGYLFFKLLLASQDEAIIEGVFDGHGIKGKLIADSCVSETRNYIYENINNIEIDYILFFNNLISILNNKTQINYRYQGGTTATINIFLKGIIYNCNCGDSDSKLFSKHKNLKKEPDTFTDILNISKSHSPLEKEEFDFMRENKPEIKFLYQMGNIEHPIYDEFGNLNDVSTLGLIPKNVNGDLPSTISNSIHYLAMTRSIGDGDLSRKDPSICVYDISDIITSEYDLCLVIASDGLWDNWKDEDIKKFVFNEKNLLTLKEENGIKKVTETLLKKNDTIGKRNFGNHRDNTTLFLTYLTL